MSDTIFNISKEGFKALLENSRAPVLIDFWAPWCTPCRMLGPELEGLKTDMGESLVVAKVNVDEEPELAENYDIQSIPNLILFKKGEKVHQMVGFKDRKALKTEIEGKISYVVS